MYENEIKEICFTNGVCHTGFSHVGDCLPDDVPQDLEYAVSFAYRLSPAVLSTITDKPSIMYFQHYRAVNAKLDSIALDLCTAIGRWGYKAFPIAASQSRNTDKQEYCGVFPHKTAAVRAGMGSIGKNGLFIDKVGGVGVRLATVLTDMPVEIADFRYENICGCCRKCVDACPANAIRGKDFMPGMKREELFDAAACSRHMKTYKNIGRGAVCGLCMSVCPHCTK